MPNQTIESAKSHPRFLSTVKGLITNRFYSENNLVEKKTAIPVDDLDFSAWLATIIASSAEEKDKQLASIFAILLFLENRDNPGLVKTSYIILSRSGNLIASRFFDEIFVFEAEDTIEEREVRGFKTHFGTVLDYELSAKLSTNQIKAGDLQFIGSDYQKSLWNSLIKTDSNIAISAPTSAGKSYVIQNFLKKQFEDNDALLGIYVVPTRALIAQVSERLKLVLPEDVSINTAFVEDEEPDAVQFDDKQIFIVTPERCLKLIQYSYKEHFEPDFIFMDEIQNIESNDGRGFLLEYLINEINAQWSGSRIIIAGPFLDQPEILFDKLFQRESEKKQTLFSPVFQLKVGLKPSVDDPAVINASLHFMGQIVNVVPVELGFDFKAIIKKGKGKALVEMVMFFGKNTQNIIYVPRTDYAEYYALQLSEKLQNENQNLDADIAELIELVKEEVHEEYYLIDALGSKSAFHHGKLPEILRAEIEYLFSARKLDNLVCTATLMEGVNLPAQKVFVSAPKKDNIPLTSFEFGNIIGRAGRVRDSLIGSIYCLQGEDENWAEEKYNSNPEKQIEPAIYKVLSIPIDQLATVLATPLDQLLPENEYAVCFLKHKYLKGDQAFADYLTKKSVPENDIVRLSQALEARLEGLTIPYELLRMNPSIDPELQDKLFKRLTSENIAGWVIHENENLFKQFNKETRVATAHNQNNLLGQLEVIGNKLDGIFNFQREAYFKHQVSRSVSQMLLYAVKWMQNLSMNQLIKAEIYFYSEKKRELDATNRKQVNTLINEVIKVYSTVISFILVKYFKLLADILNVVLSEEQKELYKRTLSLHIMLELGAQNAVVLLLITKGISRSVAIKVFPLIPVDSHEDPLAWLKQQGTLRLNPVYVRYLRRKRFLAVDDEE